MKHCPTIIAAVVMTASMTACFTARDFVHAPLENQSVTFTVSDPAEAYQKAVDCVYAKIGNPRRKDRDYRVFDYMSDTHYEFEAHMKFTDHVVGVVFYSTDGDTAKLELGDFCRYDWYNNEEDHDICQPGKDFYGNQYDYIAPIVSKTLDDFSRCMKN